MATLCITMFGGGYVQNSFLRYSICALVIANAVPVEFGVSSSADLVSCAFAARMVVTSIVGRSNTPLPLRTAMGHAGNNARNGCVTGLAFTSTSSPSTSHDLAS